MKKVFLALLTLSLLGSSAFAGETFVGYGLGVFHSADYGPVTTKVIQGGYRQDLTGGFYWQARLGYWNDSSHDSTRKSSLYGSTGLGFLIDLRPIEMRSGWGIGGISTPDSMLGGRFPQFNGELYVGVRDKNGNGIGFQYEHISSAGIVTPNEGRDFVTLQLSTKW
jgi:hypothetical protein